MESGTTVRAYPRLHTGLMDLGNATMRTHGGAGFCIAGPAIEIHARHGGTEINLFGAEKLDCRAQADVIEVAKDTLKTVSSKGVCLNVRRMIPQHVGLGSKTALLLATASAISLNAGADLSQGELQSLTRRGGVSGVGIHSYFLGGFIVDVGHQSPKPVRFLPSSAVIPDVLPLLAMHIAIPNNWTFHLVLPEPTGMNRQKEIDLFRTQTPIPALEVQESLSLLYHGVVPAVLEAEVDVLGLALRQLHRVGFKKRELNAQTLKTQKAYAQLAAVDGWAVGMSSLGPLLYVVSQDPDDGLVVQELCSSCGYRMVGSYSGRNQGFELLTT